MKNIALFVYIVLVLLVKALGFAFIVSMVLWILGLFGITCNTVLGLFVSTFCLALINGALMEMIKKGAL